MPVPGIQKLVQCHLFVLPGIRVDERFRNKCLTGFGEVTFTESGRFPFNGNGCSHEVCESRYGTGCHIRRCTGGIPQRHHSAKSRGAVTYHERFPGLVVDSGSDKAGSRKIEIIRTSLVHAHKNHTFIRNEGSFISFTTDGLACAVSDFPVVGKIVATGKNGYCRSYHQGMT
ncbi:Uncharacterised protein [Escherichia coli]|nr:Uncharacterised protein [Escherichia coli]